MTDLGVFEVLPDFDGIGFPSAEVRALPPASSDRRTFATGSSKSLEATRSRHHDRSRARSCRHRQRARLRSSIHRAPGVVVLSPLRPRPDLLPAARDEEGFSDVVLDDMADFQSEYLRNTAVVSTVLTDRQGAAVRITDFAPRYRQFGRVFRPPQLIRMIEPVAGLPRITIRFRPTHDYGHPFAQHSVGSNHVRYLHEGTVIRLTTDAPLSYIESEAPFVLTRPLHLVFGVDERFQDDLETCREFCDRTIDYWMDWSRGLSISYDWQDEIIRAAITLKLSNFEETGGIIAAHTTSIPEAPGSGRTWDYRYCWLRDAYFVVKALNRIGATQTMEDFISFTLSIASNPNELMRPVYGVVPIDPMDEKTAPALKGYRGDGPVRIGNAAAEQVQNDTYGSVISPQCRCSTTAGCRGSATKDCSGCLESLGAKAGARLGSRQRYLGISRAPAHPYPFDRDVLGGLPPARRHRFAARPAGSRRLLERRRRARAPRAAAGRLEREAAGFPAAFGSDDLDASVLLLPDLGVIEAEDPRFVSTVTAMERELLREKHVMRYAAADDFGLPATAFLICRFWLVDAWWSLGRREERSCSSTRWRIAIAMGCYRRILTHKPGRCGEIFPQTYSMAGLILTAMRLSRSWEDRYWRGWWWYRIAWLSRAAMVKPADWRSPYAPCSSGTAASGSAGAERFDRRRRHHRTIQHGDMSYVLTDLVEADYQEYYNGFANRVLWPILHYRLDLAEFSRRDLSGYRRVNAFCQPAR